MQQTFGGDWTQGKLKLLGEYLRKYTLIFDKNPWAQRYTTVYIDAFAGTGGYSTKSNEPVPGELFSETIGPETAGFFDGSTRIALRVEPAFDRYLFIERSAKRCEELARLRQEFPEKSANIQIENEDANTYLARWCRMMNRSTTRAVLFLDPFGMEIEWSLLEAIASTHAIDMWLWFPIGGINRHLKRNEPPPDEWAKRISRVLGTEEWKQEWYPTRTETTLFGDEETQTKDTDFDRIKSFFVKRLKTIFTGVAEDPRIFKNSNNVPLFLFCFATGATTPTAKQAAVNIAQYLLKRG